MVALFLWQSFALRCACWFFFSPADLRRFSLTYFFASFTPMESLATPLRK